MQNLSPSRCRSELTPTETERDLDDLENYSNHSDSLIERTNGRESERTNERELSSDRSNERASDSGKTEWVEVNDVSTKDPLDANKEKEFLSDILDDTEASCSKDVKDSTSLEQSIRSDVVSDPLKDFSDVDLS